jgi:sensor histidine kinase YesM
VRFPDKFNFSIVAAPDVEVENTLIPPMMAQPFIENAIVHGILNKTNGLGIISIRFSIQHEYLSLEIEDNGIGREKSRMLNRKDNSHLSIATNITEERLSILNRRLKIKNSLRISDLYDEHGLPAGTRAIFLFPLITT